MARLSAHRASSSDGSSDTSTGSCIEVARDNTTPTPPRPVPMDSTRSSVGASSLQSTPPTSLGDMNSEPDASKDDPVSQSGRRSSRPRTSVGTYNDKVNAGTAVHTRTAFLMKDDDGKPVSRNVSGVTLVDDTTDEANGKTLKDGVKALDKDWKKNTSSGSSTRLENMDKPQRRQSTKRTQLEHAASNVAGAVSHTAANMTSALGKRMRDAVHSTEKFVARRVGFSDKKGSLTEPPNKVSRLFPNLQRGGFAEDDDDEDEDEDEEQAMSQPARRKRKKYLEQGLYVGQFRDFDPRLTESKNKKKLQSMGGARENPILPRPMFAGEEMLKRERDFVLPYDILSPLPRDEAPKDWSKLNKSKFTSSRPIEDMTDAITDRFIGDAYASWKRVVLPTLDASYCDCEKKGSNVCLDNCINRLLQYECHKNNCKFEHDCGNRPFAQLKFRQKNKNQSRRREDEKPEQNLWGEGVEVLKTENRGYGVRAMRTFEPGQIIVEYCGEIINQEECDRRMNEEYKEKTVRFDSVRRRDETKRN
jgi:palmitoyltransferase ZDHHC9/14/18